MPRQARKARLTQYQLSFCASGIRSAQGLRSAFRQKEESILELESCIEEVGSALPADPVAPSSTGGIILPGRRLFQLRRCVHRTRPPLHDASGQLLPAGPARCGGGGLCQFSRDLLVRLGADESDNHLEPRHRRSQLGSGPSAESHSTGLGKQRRRQPSNGPVKAQISGCPRVRT